MERDSKKMAEVLTHDSMANWVKTKWCYTCKAATLVENDNPPPSVKGFQLQLAQMFKWISFFFGQRDSF